MSDRNPHFPAALNHWDHVIGPPEAAVTLLEYGDYECSHCGRAYPIVNEVIARLGDAMRFVFRHFPLVDIHPHAAMAAEAAEAAGAQRRFWEMHDTLFTHQGRLDEPDLLQYALVLGLDGDRFAWDLAEDRYAERVTADYVSGVRSGVQGTPTFFVNGTKHEGSWELPVLLAAVRQAAAAAGQPLGGGGGPWHIPQGEYRPGAGR